MIFASMSLQPGWVIEHGEPPFLEYTFHSLPNIIRADRVYQRLRAWASKNDALLSDDVTLNDPVTAAFIQVKLSFVDRGTGSIARVMAADLSFWNIRAFQFRRPLGATFPNAVMHRFEISDPFIRKCAGGDDQKINVAGLRVEVSAG